MGSHPITRLVPGATIPQSKSFTLVAGDGEAGEKRGKEPTPLPLLELASHSVSSGAHRPPQMEDEPALVHLSQSQKEPVVQERLPGQKSV